MKRIVYLCCLLLSILATGFSQTKTGNTYAVVIGISAYENSNIKPLGYSDKDAQLFARWLQSRSGGNVPDSNIRLFINEQASLSAVYNALDWLKEQCKEGDVVYFYFSGHGDLETGNHDNKGYLLTYNTPPHNYPNHAIAVEQLNKDANYLTLQKKVKVILITDACHSGKLAGDFFKGKEWVARQLQQVLNQEIRLTACSVDEEAAEGEFWGGGRGAFSYYLLMGLYGMADRMKDGAVSFQELQLFLDSSFKADAFLQIQKFKQTPVTDGNPGMPMSVADTTELNQYKAQQHVPQSPVVRLIDYFFSKAAQYPLESFIDFSHLPRVSTQTFPFLIVDSCIRLQDSIDRIVVTDQLPVSFANADTLRLFKQQLLKEASLQKQFIQLFTELVHNNAQSMINAYLNGEESELEKRQYYYSGARNYRGFLAMIHTALSLIPANHHLREVLQVNVHYLSGLVSKLEMAVSNKSDSLLRNAFMHQYQALELEPYAAYVHNELANLYVHQKRFDSAQYHYDMAVALAGTWAIPWSNQVRMNLMKKDYQKAKWALHKADSLQPDLSYVYMNAGLLMEKENNWLDAMSYFLRASWLNPVHFLPFERLAYLYLNMGDYENANRYFFKTTSLKKDFAINESYFHYGIELGGMPPVEAMNKMADSCFKQMPLSLISKWPLVALAHTISQEKKMSSESYINRFRSLLSEDPQLPLVHYYLGKKLLETGQPKEAAVFLQQAVEYYKSDSALKAYTQVSVRQPALVACLLKFLPYLNYSLTDNYYLLAKAYELQQKYTEAASVYNQILILENEALREQAVFKNYRADSVYASSDAFAEDYYYISRVSPRNTETQKITYPPYEYLLSKYEDPVKITSVIKLMQLYEQLHNYEQAEAVLLQQVVRSRQAGDLRRTAIRNSVPGTTTFIGWTNYFWVKANRELEITVHDFYKRMMALQPRNYYWKQQAGVFLYNRLLLAYQQMPQEHFVSFTNSITDYAYPWNGMVEAYEPQTATWPVPLLNDTVVIRLEAFHPVKAAIEWLKDAQALSPLKEPDIQTAGMLADLNNWMGNTKLARQWYEYVLQRQQQDSAVRRKLADLLFYAGYYRDAITQLDTLNAQHFIDSAGAQHLIFLHTVAGNFTNATSLIRKTIPGKIEDRCRALLQEANVLMLQKRYMDAITLLLKKFPYLHIDTSEYMVQMNRKALLAQRYYMMGRCYALLQQETNAVTYLKKSIDMGFCLVQVLKYDPAWNLIRKGKYQKLFVILSDDVNCTGDENFQIWLDPRDYRIPGQKESSDFFLKRW